MAAIRFRTKLNKIQNRTLQIKYFSVFRGLVWWLDKSLWCFCLKWYTGLCSNTGYIFQPTWFPTINFKNFFIGLSSKILQVHRLRTKWFSARPWTMKNLQILCSNSKQLKTHITNNLRRKICGKYSFTTSPLWPIYFALSSTLVRWW